MFTIERQRIKRISESSLSDKLLSIVDCNGRKVYVQEAAVIYPEERVRLHVIRDGRIIAYSDKMSYEGEIIAEDLVRTLRHQLGWDDALPNATSVNSMMRDLDSV